MVHKRVVPHGMIHEGDGLAFRIPWIWSGERPTDQQDSGTDNDGDARVVFVEFPWYHGVPYFDTFPAPIRRRRRSRERRRVCVC